MLKNYIKIFKKRDIIITAITKLIAIIYFDKINKKLLILYKSNLLIIYIKAIKNC